MFSSQHTEAKLTGCFVFKRQTRERYQTSDVTFSWNDDLSQNWLVKTLPREAWVILVNHQKDEDTFGQCLRGGKKRVLSVLLFGFRHMKSSKRKKYAQKELQRQISLKSASYRSVFHCARFHLLISHCGNPESPFTFHRFCVYLDSFWFRNDSRVM